MDGMDLWLIFCGVGVLLLRVGMSIHGTGLVRSKNSAGTMMRYVADLCVAALAFWLVGAAILFANHHLLAFGTFSWGLSPLLASQVFLTLCAISLAPAIAVGVASERSRFFPMLCLPVVLAGLISPLCGHWAIGGWLRSLGFRDLAGASYIHLAGGVCAAVAAIAVGPRQGKFNRDGSSNAIPGHSLPLASVGMLFMLIGWFAYLVGFAAFRGLADVGVVALNALLAAAAGGLVSMLVCNARYGKPDIHLTYASVLGSLVAISACARLRLQRRRRAHRRRRRHHHTHRHAVARPGGPHR